MPVSDKWIQRIFILPPGPFWFLLMSGVFSFYLAGLFLFHSYQSIERFPDYSKLAVIEGTETSIAMEPHGVTLYLSNKGGGFVSDLVSGKGAYKQTNISVGANAKIGHYPFDYWGDGRLVNRIYELTVNGRQIDTYQQAKRRYHNHYCGITAFGCFFLLVGAWFLAAWHFSRTHFHNGRTMKDPS